MDGAFLERQRLALTPEFDTESVAGMVLLFDGPSKATISYDGTDKVGQSVDYASKPALNFDTTLNYKADVRFNGRFLNYKITNQTGEVTLDWDLSGYQIELSKGGFK